MVKHAHMAFALLSVMLFTARWLLLLCSPQTLHRKWLKVVPHIIDTLLLASGLVMMVQLSLYPTHLAWLAEKLLWLLSYIGFGLYTLKFAADKRGKVLGYVAAMGCIAVIVHLAVSKQSFMF